MMKNLLYTILLLTISVIQGNAQFAEPGVTGANFTPNQIEEGESSILSISFANSGTSLIPAGSIELTISTAFNYYTTDKVTSPSGVGGDLFTWILIDPATDVWRGTNTNAIPGFGGGEINLAVYGNSASANFEATNINVQPVSNFNAFTDSPNNNNLQPTLKINTNSCVAGTTAPPLSSTSVMNNCPLTVVVLDDLFAGSLPLGTSLVWSQDPDHTDGISSTVNPIVNTAGTYYAYYYHNVDDCYSPPSTAVDVTIDNFCPNPTNYTTIYNSCPLLEVSLTSIFSGVLPLGIDLIWSSDGDWSDGLDDILPETLYSSDTVYVYYYDSLANCYGVANPVILEIDVCNYPPIGINDVTATETGVPVTGSVLDNDIDPDNDGLTVSINPLNETGGTVVINPDGTYTFTPESLFSGNASFEYVVCDDYNPPACDTALVVINVIDNNHPNNAPIGIEDNFITEMDITISADLISNDNDPDGDVLVITTIPVDDADFGTLTINPDGTYTYVPDPGFIGTDEFTYEVCDIPTIGNVMCDVVEVTIEVLSDDGQNDIYATDDVTVGQRDNFQYGDVSANDFDPEGDSYVVTLLDSTTHGNILLEPDGTYTFLPDPGYTGNDFFTYVICDDGSPQACDVARVSITVLYPVVDVIAVNDTVIAHVNTPIIIDVLANDTVEYSIFDSSAIVTILPSGNSTAVVNPDGTITYTPAPDFSGMDIVTYVVCDTTSNPYIECDTAQIIIEVSPFFIVRNVCPEEEIDLYEIHNADVPLGLEIVWSTDDNPDDGLDTILPTPHTQSDTLYMYYHDPIADCYGPGRALYLIIEPCEYPPHVVPNPITTLQDSTAEICMPINDLNSDDTHTATLCGNPEHGDAVVSVVNGELCVEYTPDSGYSGTDEICIIVCDKDQLCDEVTLPVTVVPALNPTPNPEPPVLIVTPINVPENDTVELCTPILDPNVGDRHGAILCGASPYDVVVDVSVDNGYLCLVYTPEPGYYGEDEVCIIVCDQTGLCDTVDIPITVFPSLQPIDTIQPPVVSVPPVVVTEDSAAVICAPIVDPNPGDIHTVSNCGGPDYGTANVVLNNSDDVLCISYTPDEGFVGYDELCLVVCDQTGLCDTVIIPITVMDQPSVLDANDDGPEIITGLNPQVIDILENDTDLFDDPATTANVSLPDVLDDPHQGAVTVQPDGSVVYTALPGASGFDSFTYVICDLIEINVCDTATVLVYNNLVECDTPDAGYAYASDVIGQTGETASFTLENYVADQVTWHIASPFAVPNTGTGDNTGPVAFLQAGEYTIVFTLNNRNTPANCSAPATVFATTRYYVEDPLQECDAPTYSPVAVDPIQTAIFNGEEASFNLVDGQPYTYLTWQITPTSGVSLTSGGNAFTGPITFDSSGVYLIEYNYVNFGDGTCEPVENTATAYLNVGLSPCFAPSPILVACTPYEPYAEYAVGESITFNASGGTPGDMTWTIISSTNFEVATGTGNTVTQIFDFPGEFFIVFSSNNSTFPQNCTQMVGTSVTKKVVVVDQNPPSIDDIGLEVPENGSISICEDFFDPNSDNTHTVTTCDNPTNGGHIATIDDVNDQLCLEYTPNPGFSGNDEICLILCDNTGLCDTLIVSIEVTPSPNLIEAEDDVVFVVQGIDPDTVDVLSNDTANNGNPANISNVKGPDIITNGSHGNASILPDGSMAYTPQAGAFGLDTVFYQICDPIEITLCDTAMVIFLNIPVPCQEAEPGVATASDITGPVGSSASFSLEDYVGDEVSWSIASNNAVPNSGTGDFTGDVYFLQPGIYTVVFEIESHSTPTGCSVPSTVFATTRYIVVAPTPECEAPTQSPVDISPSSAAIFTGEEATFELLNGQPYTTVTWTISPLTGVSAVAGNTPVTGPIRFDSSGVYTIQYNYVNYGDGTCEPVEASATGYINVGLNPCTPPSPIYITTNPSIAQDDTITMGETIGFLAAGGLPGNISWELITPNGTRLFGTGNALNYTFTQNGEYYIVFSSTNSLIPIGCTQSFGNSETMRIIVEENNPPQIVFPDVTLPNDSIITVCTDIIDPDASDVHTADLCDLPEHGDAVVWIDPATGEVCFSYNPDDDYSGVDEVCIVVCDSHGDCDEDMVIVSIMETNDPPVALDDSTTIDQEQTVLIEPLSNDYDPNHDSLTISIIDGPSQGTVTLTNGDDMLYDPIDSYTGWDSITYVICDDGNPMLCDTAVVYIQVTTRFICVNINGKVFLEGALVIPDGSQNYDNIMRTDLNDLRLLPGQAYSEGFFGAVQYNPLGHPYNLQPWWYTGSEGSNFDSGGDPDEGDAGYASTVVDWVLVSLRRDVTDEFGSEICQRAALLHHDGTVEIVGDDCCLVDSTESFYLVIQHRNHLPVMSSNPIDVVGQSITHDFTISNSYREGDPNFGALVGNGQKEVLAGIFAMYAGNGEQRFNQNDTDITADDQLIWTLDNGKIADYIFADFNMNGDVNFNDLILWSQNNGKFTTVPRDENQ